MVVPTTASANFICTTRKRVCALPFWLSADKSILDILGRERELNQPMRRRCTSTTITKRKCIDMLQARRAQHRIYHSKVLTTTMHVQHRGPATRPSMLPTTTPPRTSNTLQSSRRACATRSRDDQCALHRNQLSTHRWTFSRMSHKKRSSRL